jgi:acyl-CoA synthetase (AMP-forming)/AMP-acid ligase II
VDDRPTITLPDLGYLEGNSLYLTGRADEVFNLSGTKIAFDIFQQAIEKQVPGCDVGIAAATDIGRDHELVIAIAAPGQLDLAGVRAAALASLGMEKAKDYIRLVQVDTVPRNAMGKVDRREVLRRFQEAIGGPGRR